MRPEFRRLCKEYSDANLAKLFNTTEGNIRVMKHRGYLTKKTANNADNWLGYKYSLLIKKG